MLLNTKICLVDHPVPVRVLMVKKLRLMRFGNHLQRPILDSRVLKWCPRRHNIVRRTKREISQILVHWVTRAATHPWWLVYEHRVDRLDVLAAETFEVGDEFGVGAVALENLVELEILELGDWSLSLELFTLVLLNQGNIFNNLHPRRPSITPIIT